MNHFVGKNQRTKPNLCLHCGRLLDAASGLDTDAKPDPGDVSLCIVCNGVMIFADDLTLRLPTPAEYLEISNHLGVQIGRRAISMIPEHMREQQKRKPS